MITLRPQKSLATARADFRGYFGHGDAINSQTAGQRVGTATRHQLCP